MRALALALRFLTILPLPGEGAWDAQTQRRSLAWYPLVGALVGLGLALPLVLSAWLELDLPAMPLAAIILLLWVLLCGALHLDGLADSFDAWLGGHGDRERTLAIMKDPASGPAGVVSLLLVLLLKFSALVVVVEAGAWPLLILIPALARGLLPFWFSLLPYVRPGGLGDALADYRPGPLLYLQLMPLLGWLYFSGEDWGGAFTLAALLLLFILWRRSCLARIGGTTGDTAGALVEMAEACLLLGVALSL